MNEPQTLGEIYFTQLLKLRYNVYENFFKFHIQNEPFKVQIRFYCAFKQISNLGPGNKIMGEYTFTIDEIRRMFELPIMGCTEGIEWILIMLDEKIDLILQSVETNFELVKGLVIDREFSILALQGFK